MTLAHTDCIGWLTRLISFNTISSQSNLALIDAVHQYLNDQGLQCRIIRDPVEEKANLFVTFPAESMQDGLVLSGHTDVVPVSGQNWQQDPFQALQKDDKIYGRGACDMKGFLAVALALVPFIKSLSLKKPVHFAFSYNEETGCDGAPFMIEDFKTQGIQPKACVVGEPTLMEVVSAHKGISLFHCKITGVAAHSSLTPQGCNAIHYAAQLILFIQALADQFAKEGPHDNCYDVPYTTLSTNMINGGNAFNIIPGNCEFYLDCRHLPSSAPQAVLQKIRTYVDQELLPRMRERHRQANIEVELLAQAPAFESFPQSEIRNWLQQLLQQSKTIKVAYATEAGLFQRAEMDTIICGPGSIEQAHRPNEFVAIDQLYRCEKILKQLVTSWCT